MPKTFAYIRTSSNAQQVRRQREEIEKYAKLHGIYIDDFIEAAAADTKRSRQKRIHDLIECLNHSDTILVPELSQLGRSTGEVILLLNQLIDVGVTVTVLNDNLHLSNDLECEKVAGMVRLLTEFADMEQEFVKLHTDEALATRRASGVNLGKPKGTIQSSIYDKDRTRIEELLELGLSQRKIVANHLKYGTVNSLGHYIRTRGIRTKSPKLD